jgi:flagellar protein FlaG
MTDALQISSVTAAAAARPAVKRADTAPAVALAKADAKPAATTDAAQPVEPVVKVEPTRRLSITRDEDANTFVYRSINADTGEVVWQYPAEQVLRMAQRLRELEGLDTHQVDQKV